MKSLKVPDLNERLQNLKKIFENETRLFKLNIEEKTERFTKEDQRDFDILLEEIKKDVMRRLDAFITEKITKKSVTFESSVRYGPMIDFDVREPNLIARTEIAELQQGSARQHDHSEAERST